VAAVAVVAFAVLGVWGQEPRGGIRRTGDAPPAGGADAPRHAPMWETVRSVAAMSQARRFFAFMLVCTLFFFLQLVILEPYGGDVLGLNVKQTSAFNAVLTTGVLLGMLVAGRSLADRYGPRRIAVVALVFGSSMFALLASAAFSASAPPSWLSVFGIGLATGVFNVGILTMMMGMVDQRRVAFFIGAWTVAHAFAKGVATAGGGVIYELANSVFGNQASGYGTVFAVQAVGLLCCLPLLRKLDQRRFQAEVEAAADAERVDDPPADRLPATSDGPVIIEIR
jgi:MFS transporter, BCD family, chlorophyll transporter